MDLHPDWKEFIEFFNANSVEFVVVGAYAVGFYTTPRSTADIDFVVRQSEPNARRVKSALDAFGIGLSSDEASKLLLPSHVIQLGAAPYRIDIHTSIDGVTTDELIAHQVSGTLGGLPVQFPSLGDLIATKRAAGRPKDLADLNRLEHQPMQRIAL